MSIFEKTCPQCASSSPVNAVSCACGYCFDPEHAGEEYLAQEERLYRDYLAARLVQAEAALTVARAEAAADPGNQVKAAQALLAEQALNAARAELRALTTRPARRRPAPRATAPAATPASVRQARRPVVAKPAVPARSGNAVVAEKAPAPRPESKTAGTAPPPAVLSAKPAVAPAPPTAITEKPGPVFRAVQTVKAEAAIRTRPVEPKRATAGTRAHPEAAARAAQVAAMPSTTDPAKTAKTKAARKECPHCTAVLPIEATRCRCGFSLPTVAVEMPPVALDAETAALLKGLDLGSSR